MRKIKLLFSVFIVFVVACLFFSGSFLAFANPDIELNDHTEEIYLIKGDLETIKTHGLQRISITSPDIADIADLQEDNVLMIGKQPGHTPVFVWDQYGKRNLIVRVFDDDLGFVKDRLETLLAKADIKGIKLDINQSEGKVILSGNVAPKKKEEFEKLIGAFGSSIMNFVKPIGEEDLIQIDAMIAELNTTLSKVMGFDWTSALAYTETLPNKTIDGWGDYFKIGEFKRSTQIISTINALITEGKGRVLSKPKLVTETGKDASFLVGGEIPIVTTSTTATAITENVTYRSYGVNLTINPTITDDNRVDIKLTISISDIDASNAVGDKAAFTTRNAQTQLLLDNGQTVVLAGLLKQNKGETITRIPILSDVPVMGALFRKKSSSPNSETELVVSLTPTILKSSKSLAQKAKESERKVVIISKPTASQSESSQFSSITVESPSGSASSIGDQAMNTSTFVPKEMVSYIRDVQEKIAQTVIYPEMARQYGWEGTVKLDLSINYDGTLKSVIVKESSGHDVFDYDAVNTAQKLSPYSVFPPEIDSEQINITIPIVYSLKNSL